jgi:hypothetical protein
MFAGSRGEGGKSCQVGWGGGGGGIDILSHHPRTMPESLIKVKVEAMRRKEISPIPQCLSMIIRGIDS